jgi:alpha-L-rhamnosidase
MEKRIYWILLLWGIVTLQLSAAPLTISDLRCEYLANPLGIDEPAPRLSWKVASNERSQKQTAYRIIVASNESLLRRDRGDLWDSGKRSSSQTQNVPYSGTPLRSGQRCYWRVKVWDAKGRQSEWSQTSSWSRGLKQEDWKAEWISYKDTNSLHADRNQLFLPPARYYRKEFTAKKAITHATLYAAALGIYEMQLNGKQVSENFFTPGWSDYLKRVYYNTFDVTDQLQKGQNAIGAIVADGWYSGYVGYGLLVGYGPNRVGRYFYGKTPAFLAQIEIEYADGSSETIITDPSWRVTGNGPIREADLIMGETFDARLEKPDWSNPGFEASTWEPAIRAQENGSTKAKFFDTTGEREVELGFQKPKTFQAYPAPPVRITGELKTLRMTEPEPGAYIFDLGQNFAGTIRLNVKAPAGTKIQIRYAEMLHQDGRLMTENLRKARATDYYVCRGDSNGETWTPRFTYHGFQFVELRGVASKPELDAVTGLVLNSDTPLTSSFECSDPMANRLFKNMVWTQRANFIELPTDCPQRDERLGWMGDAQIYARSASFNADVSAFFTKWMYDVEEAQRDSGAYPDYCPYPMSHGAPNQTYGTAWTDAGLIVPWTVWLVYNDTRIIERHYDSFKRFMEFRKKRSPKFFGVADGNTWGDWLNLQDPTPVEYVDTCYFAYCASLMSHMAGVIGRTDDAASYRELFDKIKSAFNQEYVNADGTLKVSSQTAHVLALEFGLLPTHARTSAANQLVSKIVANDHRMSTGFLGTKPLLPVLTANGHHDLAVRLFQSKRFPSWGYEVENGATTIWERWDSYTKEDGFGRHNAAMNSFSHYAFGAVCEWMFKSLAGIETDGSGFQRIYIHPGPPKPGSNPETEPIHWIKASYDSPHGKIISAWKVVEGSFHLDVTIPANTTATVSLPIRDTDPILEDGKPIRRAKGVELLCAPGRTILRIDSGSYNFSGPFNQALPKQ